MAGPIGTKFCTEVVLERGKFLGGVSTQYPHPSAYRVHKGGAGCLWSLNHAFWWKLYKTKVAGHPWFSGGWSPFWAQIWIRKDLGPLSFWSHGHSPWREAHKIKVVWYVLNSYLVRLDTPYLDPQVQGAHKGGPVGFWGLRVAFWQKL